MPREVVQKRCLRLGLGHRLRGLEITLCHQPTPPEPRAPDVESALSRGRKAAWADVGEKGHHLMENNPAQQVTGTRARPSHCRHSRQSNIGGFRWCDLIYVLIYEFVTKASYVL